VVRGLFKYPEEKPMHRELTFHVYTKNNGDRVVAHNLNFEQLEDLVYNGTIDLNKHEVVPIKGETYEIEASY